MSASGIGYELGISRQVVQYHIGLTVRAERVANPLTPERRRESRNTLILQDNIRNQQMQKTYI
jgi:hypothetical protein